MEDEENQERFADLERIDPEEGERRRQVWRDLFGREPPPWESEANAPEITEELVQQFRDHVNGLLSQEEDIELLVMAARFRSIAELRSRIWDQEKSQRN